MKQLFHQTVVLQVVSKSNVSLTQNMNAVMVVMYSMKMKLVNGVLKMMIGVVLRMLALSNQKKKKKLMVSLKNIYIYIFLENLKFYIFIKGLYI